MANNDEGVRDPKREDPSQSRRAGGPSPLDERDEIAMSGHKSRWQEANSPAAGDPMTVDEKNGLSLLGGSNVRGGAIPGVSDPRRDGSGAPKERPGEGIRQGGPGGRKSPELVPDAGMGDGGIDMSGGAAGGARGHGGTSSAGAGGPMGDTAGGPAQHDAASRADLDHPSDDERAGERRKR
jgi:hypothetical protein